MGKELQKLRTRKEVRQRLEAINGRRDMCLVIHYSCESFYRVLKGKPVAVADGKKIDLARELVALFGVKYAPHGGAGRLHSLMDMNHITAKDALTGAGEAEAFEKQEYVKLHQSTLRKVDVIANLLDRTLDGSLKTKATWFDQHGFHPIAVIEWINEHWLYAGLGIVALLLGLYVTFKDMIWPATP